MKLDWQFHKNNLKGDDWIVYLLPTVWYQYEAFMKCSWHSINIAFLHFVFQIELEHKKRV